ncbi:MAG: hypothetical protein P1V18_01260 [Candidatus Gracilibacteria bacterium]|nr:hypothetical protein [Candidatus Gracilibacteria bacterium]
MPHYIWAEFGNKNDAKQRYERRNPQMRTFMDSLRAVVSRLPEDGPCSLYVVPDYSFENGDNM